MWKIAISPAFAALSANMRNSYKNIDLLEVTKQQKTYNGFVFQQTENQTLTVNVIPIKLTYQLDIYTKKYEDCTLELNTYITTGNNYSNPYGGIGGRVTF